MHDTTIQKAHEIGQSIRFDYTSRDLIDSGELKRLVDGRVRGVTSNPAITDDLLVAGVKAFANAFEGLIGVTGSELRGLFSSPASD